MDMVISFENKIQSVFKKLNKEPFGCFSNLKIHHRNSSTIGVFNVFHVNRSVNIFFLHIKIFYLVKT